jgi:glycosyl transferase family 7 (putative galactosyltransferase)
MSRSEYKISLCTVCMNRLHHLRETLIKNIEDNEDYEDLQFIVLDYNSKDGTDSWVRETLADQLLSGRLVYYKTAQPDRWNPSHSKNIIFRLSEGDILCNIWADYFTGKHFASYVNQEFKKNENIVLTPIAPYGDPRRNGVPPDIMGKVCVRKLDFLRINGFDERMDKHGFEDHDFVNRLELIDIKRVLIRDSAYLKFLPHGDEERYPVKRDTVQDIYINYRTPSISDCLILYKHGAFERGEVVDNTTIDSNKCAFAYRLRDFRFDYSVGSIWQSGTWEGNKEAGIRLWPAAHGSTDLQILRPKDANTLVEVRDNVPFFRLSNEAAITSLLKFRHFLATRVFLEDNLRLRNPIVNPNGFGKATVSVNFQEEPTKQLL